MYRPTAAGHGAREAPRSVEQKTLDERLVERAMEWCSGGAAYSRALKAVEGLTVTAKEAELLTLNATVREHDRFFTLGLFISALWNTRCSEKIITYGQATPGLWDIGYALPREKMLIVTQDAGNFVGGDAKGTIITLENTGFSFGNNAAGPLVVGGTIKEDLCRDATGVVITTTQAHLDDTFKGKHITPELYKKNASLKKYVNRLLYLARNGPHLIEREFGDGERIASEIERRAGGTR